MIDEVRGYCIESWPRIAVNVNQSRIAVTAGHRAGVEFERSGRELTPTGVARLDLKAGDTGRAKIGMKGKGALLAIPALPIQSLPVTVQLMSSDGTCWTSTFSSAARNDASQFKATSD